MAVAAGAAMLRGPARADDPDGTTESVAKTGTPRKPAEPFDLSYANDEDSQGVFAVRPAAAFRRSGMEAYRTMLNVWIGQQWAKAAKALGFDPTKPGQRPPRVELFDQVIASVRVYRTKGPKPNGRLALGLSTIKTTEPVDWVGLARLFKAKISEVRDGDRVYYRLKDTPLAPECYFFCPDERTIVFSGEEMPAQAEQRLLRHLRRTAPPPAPVFAQGKDWDRFIHGLLLVTLDNRGGRLAKPLRGEPEDEDFGATPFVEHTNFWTLGLDEGDQMVLRGVGTCPDDGASESTAHAINEILGQARKEMEKPDAKKPSASPGEEMAIRMAGSFFTNLRVERDGCSVFVRSAGFGTLADYASLVVAGVVPPFP
jgi:hypothetical protein